MGFRFRKSVKLGKGIKLNFGRKSAGISFGGKRGGVSINSRTGAKARASIPGSGISYSAKLPGGRKAKAPSYNTTRKAATTRVARSASTKTTRTVKPKNPLKPPKSAKVYLLRGIVMVSLGLFLLFTSWVLGLISITVGIYYIICGPKIYADLVAKYKEAHPKYKEGQ